MAKLVVVAVSDDRAASDAAFEYAAANQVGPCTHLLIVYARPARKAPAFQFSSPNQLIRYKTYTQPVEEMYSKRSREVLERYAELARHAKLNFAAVEVEGPPHEAISAKCEEVHADLLVISSTERSLLKKLALGESADKLMSRHFCPVLVVRELKVSKVNDSIGLEKVADNSALLEELKQQKPNA